MSASAFILGNHPDIQAIVADSPYATLEGLIARQFFFFPGFTKWPLVALTKFYARLFLGVRVNDAVPSEVVWDLNTPLLIIHGDADSQIPLEHSQAIYANADPEKTTLWIVRGADHGFAHGFEGLRYEVRVREFFDQHLCPAAHT
ncbi:MAG: alpha/beta hydrolase [Nitrospirales bacterium]|nr:alpha/beta hydrolase [Nitrospirales bacterium]